MKLIECIFCKSSESITEVIDRHNRVAYKCNICGKTSPQATTLDSRIKLGITPKGVPYHFSVGILIFNNKKEILLVKRRFHDYTWSLFFGHVHNGENFRQTVQRELLEETAIYTNKFKFHFKQTFKTDCRTGVVKHECAVFSIKIKNDSFIMSNNEAQILAWVPLNKLNSPKYRPLGESTQAVLKKLRLIT